MDKKEFEKLVTEGISEIPEKFLKLLDNVAVIVEEGKDNGSLFGLYEGIPKTARGQGYSWVLPDKITIFMRPILRAARDEEEVKQIVRDTVWHEIAHHFGFSETAVRKAEKKRKKKNML